MNYLAHAYLSSDKEQLLYGNFIGDFIKGKNNPDLPEKIWEGVVLHRAIDHETDRHKATREAKSLVRSELGLTSGIFIDMIFDHILAKRWLEYSEMNLQDYSIKTYAIIDQFKDYHPEKFAFMFSYMKRNDWLGNYVHPDQMQRFINGLSRRIKVSNKLKNSFHLFHTHEEQLEALFEILFQDLINLQPK